MDVEEARKSVKDQKVLVLGLAKTGVSVVHCLEKLGAIITVNDIKPLDENKEAQDLVEENVRVIAGYHPVELLDEDFAFMVKNPGISYDNPMVQRAEEIGLPVITDIELVSAFTYASIVGITGSNGKTTTTSLTYDIVQHDAKRKDHFFLGGNIGIPALDIAMDRTSEDTLILELSSFQLQGTLHFHPHIAAIIDIYPTHLDWHGTMENYVNAKWKITANQTADDYLILNADQNILWSRREQTAAQIIPFSMERKVDDGSWYNQEKEQLMWGDEVVISRSDLFIPGQHNVQNALVAIAICKLLGFDNETIKAGCQNFHGVKHRIQFVREVNGRTFYNDSKATNNEAAITALDSFDQPVVWICGGLDRHNSLEDIKPHLKHVHAMVVMGETADKFEQLGREAGIKDIVHADWVEDAVTKAYDLSQPGDVILLSPASASWDQYPEMEVRGDRYIDAVNKL